VSQVRTPFTAEGRRRLAKLIVDDGWSIRRAAERFQCSPATAPKWAARYRAGLPLTDRSSRPHVLPSGKPIRSRASARPREMFRGSRRCPKADGNTSSVAIPRVASRSRRRSTSHDGRKIVRSAEHYASIGYVVSAGRNGAIVARSGSRKSQTSAGPDPWSAIVKWAQTPVALPNHGFITGGVSMTWSAQKISSGVAPILGGTAADVTGIGTLVGVPADAWGVIQIFTGAFKGMRGIH
jgi:transposase-like protein